MLKKAVCHYEKAGATNAGVLKPTNPSLDQHDVQQPIAEKAGKPMLPRLNLNSAGKLDGRLHHQPEVAWRQGRGRHRVELFKRNEDGSALHF